MATFERTGPSTESVSVSTYPPTKTAASLLGGLGFGASAAAVATGFTESVAGAFRAGRDARPPPNSDADCSTALPPAEYPAAPMRVLSM